MLMWNLKNATKKTNKTGSENDGKRMWGGGKRVRGPAKKKTNSFLWVPCLACGRSNALLLEQGSRSPRHQLLQYCSKGLPTPYPRYPKCSSVENGHWPRLRRQHCSTLASSWCSSSRVFDVIGSLLGGGEHVSQSPGVDARVGGWAFHGERLTGTRLPVREDADVVPGEEVQVKAKPSSQREREREVAELIRKELRKPIDKSHVVTRQPYALERIVELDLHLASSTLTAITTAVHDQLAARRLSVTEKVSDAQELLLAAPARAIPCTTGGSTLGGAEILRPRDIA